MADRQSVNDRRPDTDRAHILREIYEDNVRIRDRQPRGSSYSAHPYVTGVSGLFVLLVTLLLAADYVFRDSAPQILVTEATTFLSRTAILLPDQSVAPDLMVHEGDIPTASEYAAIGDGTSSLRALFDLGVKTIVIDAGHGGTDPGAIGITGAREKDITLDVAERLRRRLAHGYGYRVLMTRSTDSTIALRGRAEFSNSRNADLFVSIHVNSIPDDRVVPLETYYFGPEADRFALRLAEVENQNSDYSVAEFNHMIQRMGDRIKLQESRKIARYVQRSLFGNASERNKDVSNWGVKTAPFVVLVGADAPGILAEIGVVSNLESEARLRTPEYREQIAMFLEEGIVNYLTDLTQNEVSHKSTTGNAAEEEE